MLLESLATGAAMGGLSAVSGYINNERNIDMQRETNAQNQAMQYKAWDREDNAVQRRANDMAAAGFSPTLAAGNAAASSAPIKMESPQSQDWGSPAAAAGIQGALGVSQLSKTDMDNKRTAADIGKVGAETTNVQTNTLATKQNMEIQNIMTSFQTKAIDAQTMRTKIQAALDRNNLEIGKIDLGKAKNTGVTPSSSPIGKMFNDAVGLATSNLNPAAAQQNILGQIYNAQGQGGKK